MQMSLAQNADLNDFFTAATALVDRSFMLFYCHVRKNARRISNLALALVPVMVLMVGSCKTPQSAYVAGSTTGPVSAQQLQSDLFPGAGGKNFRPAAGYIAEARDFVDSKPHALLLLTRTDIGYIFGAPSFRRRDANAEVWQYKTRSCVVDFYFYGEKPTSYVDARLKNQFSVSGHQKSRCLRQINDGNATSA